MQVDVPVSVRSHAFANLLAGLHDRVHSVVGIEDIVGDGAACRRIDPVGAVSRFDGGAGAFLQSLALDVPERHVKRAQSVDLLAAGRVEPDHVHLLPELFGPEGIFADHGARALLDQVARAALAVTGDANVGFDAHDRVALGQRLIEIRRVVGAHARNFRGRKGRFGPLHRRCGEQGCGTQ